MSSLETDDGPSDLKPSSSPEEGYTFWSYSDLAVATGIWLAAPLASSLLLGVLMVGLGITMRSEPGAGPLLLNQLIFYALLFGSLAAWLRLRYGRPFWPSLGWTKMSLSSRQILLFGVATASVVGLIGVLVRVPATPNEMTRVMTSRASLLLIGAFGITLGPLCEELAFRGFLQPLLVRSLGTVPGIIAAAIPFGLVHLSQYGHSWRHALLVSVAGSAFGWMRHRTGSTKASTMMHSSYNAVVFVSAASDSHMLW